MFENRPRSPFDAGSPAPATRAWLSWLEDAGQGTRKSLRAASGGEAIPRDRFGPPGLAMTTAESDSVTVPASWGPGYRVISVQEPGIRMIEGSRESAAS